MASTSSPSIAFDQLEVIKENVQPVKRGRDANKLGLQNNNGIISKGLSNQTSYDQQRETERQ